MFSDCPQVTAGGLLQLTSLTKLDRLTLYGAWAVAMIEVGQDSPEDTEHWLQKLTETLKFFHIQGELLWCLLAIYNKHERKQTGSY